MSGEVSDHLWQTPDAPIQVTDREPAAINVLPTHHNLGATASSQAETRPYVYNDRDESPLMTASHGTGISDRQDDEDDVGNVREYPPQLSNHHPQTEEDDTYALNNRYFEYRNLVGSISEKLRKENALRLAYVYALPGWYYEVGPTHDPTSALRILVALEGKGVFAPNNLVGLTKALETIEREDLAQIVREFRSKVAMETVTVDRRSTVPRQPSRGINNWSSSSCRSRPPKPHHSTSTTSLMPRPVEDTNVYPGDFGVYRTQSKPELEKYQVLDREALSAAFQAGGSHPSVEPSSHGGQERDAGIGLQFTLMNLKTLEDQIYFLRKHFTSTSHSNLQSSHPVNAQIRSMLDDAKLHIADSTRAIERVCDIVGAGRLASASEPPSPARSTPIREVEGGGGFPHRKTSGRRFSRSSSGGGKPISRQSSGHSTRGGGAAMFNLSLSSSRGMDAAQKQLSFDQSVEKDSSSRRRHRSGGYTELTQEDPDPQEDAIVAPFPGHMHPTPPSGQVKIKRRWSRRDEKKLSRKGVLVWQIKVKKLKEWYSQKSVSLSSEDFYDISKRKFKATLHPFGLGTDQGSYMTLCINCLDEMKPGQKIQTTDIVVRVVDPQSTEMPLPPICRQLERRGIRVFQEFISHAQVDKFLSDVVVITIALTVKREEASDQESDINGSKESLV